MDGHVDRRRQDQGQRDAGRSALGAFSRLAVQISASGGIVDGDPRAAELLLRHADAEMYRARREARAFGERQMSSSS